MTEAPAELKEIEERLNRVIGLDVRSLGRSMIALAVRTRMKKRGIEPMPDYLAALESPGEWQALLEEIVVPETWFFRDWQPFLALAEWALRDWLPRHPYNVLRILSSPCSTGEEPYSIVMALLDAGVPPERFAVEAVDISEAALAKARSGLYNRNSFRGPAQEYREQYFTKTPEGWQLGESVRSLVQFRQVNVFDSAFARKESRFDAIFCRNMMIYFDDASRARLMRQLGGMLDDEGRLFLGHAEGGIARGFGFEPLPFSMAFAFRKVRPISEASLPVPKAVAPAPAPVKKPGRRALPVPLVAPLQSMKPRQPAPKAEPAAPASPDVLLAQAQKLADAGRLEEARAQCEAALRIEGASARAHYLLGLVCDAAGSPEEAENHYRKAIYLEPNHYEALSQLALLAEKRGDTQAARQFLRRVKRSQSESAA